MSPGFIIGPSLSSRIDFFSVDFMLFMLNDKNKSGVPALSFPLADVTDVAKVHILGAFKPVATGRHILFSGEAPFFIEITKILKNEYNNKYPIPTRNVTKILLYLSAPFLKIK